MKYLFLVLLFTAPLFGQGGRSVWSTRLKDSVTTHIEDSIDAHIIDATLQPGFIMASDSAWDEYSHKDFLDSLSLDFVTPEMYGAVGDSTTDDSTGIFDCLGSGLPVVLTSGKIYRTSKRLLFYDVDANIRSSGTEKAIILLDYNNHGIQYAPTAKDTLVLERPVLANTRLLVTTTSGDVAKGDLLELVSTDKWEYENTYTKGELARVDSASTDSIWIEVGTNEAYVDSAVTIYVYDPINVKIENISIRYKVKTNKIPFGIYHATDFYIRDIEVLNGYVVDEDSTGNRCLLIQQSYNGDISNSVFKGASQTGGGYGTSITQCAYITYRENYIYDCRRGVDVSGTAYPSRYISVLNNTVAGAGILDGMGVHGGAEFVLFQGNRIFNASSNAFLLRGGSITLDNNFAYGFIPVFAKINNGENVVISRNEYNNLRSGRDTVDVGGGTGTMNNFILVSGWDGDTTNYLKVYDNVVNSLANAGKFFRTLVSMDNFEALNNTIRWEGSSAVMFSADEIDTLKNAFIKDNDVLYTTSYVFNQNNKIIFDDNSYVEDARNGARLLIQGTFVAGETILSSEVITTDTLTATNTIDKDFELSELHTDHNNAVSDAGTEANATTGWESTGLNVFQSQSDTVNVGTYAFEGDATGSPTAGARFYKNVGDTLSLGAGKYYRATFDLRHRNTGGEWRVGFSWATEIAISNIATIDSTDDSFSSYTDTFEYDTTYRNIVIREWNDDDNGGVYFDNFALTEFASFTSNGNHTYDSTTTSPIAGTYSGVITATGAGDGSTNYVNFPSDSYSSTEGNALYLSFDALASTTGVNLTAVIGTQSKTWEEVDNSSAETLTWLLYVTDSEVNQDILFYLNKSANVKIDNFGN